MCVVREHTDVCAQVCKYRIKTGHVICINHYMCVIQCVSTRVYNHVEMGIHICVTEYMSLFVCVFIYINERKYQ
jgi:hypothetical protein